MTWFIEIVTFDGNNVEARIPFQTEKVANSSVDGIEATIDNEKYFTRIVCEN